MRKREIGVAIAAGALAATAAAGIITDGFGGPGSSLNVVEADNLGPSNATYDVGAFEEISSVGPQDIVVTYGETQSVRSEGAPRALGQLEVVVENGELSIRPKQQFGGNWGSLSGATYFVTVPRLERFSIAGSGSARVDRIEGESFSGAIAGSGELSIGEMKVDEADFSIGGSGQVSAAGTARKVRISTGGSGQVEAAGLRSQTASVAIVGAGNVSLTVEEEADISIAGNGQVDIGGPARCSISQMGSGNVSCAGGGD